MHSGKVSTLRGTGMPQGYGRWIRRPNQLLRIAPSALSCTQRCTQCDGVGPLEHVAAAFLIAGWRDWCLECDDADLPIGDGSAAMFSIPRHGEVPLRHVGAFDVHLINDRGGTLWARSAASFHVRSEWATPMGLEVWEAGASSLSACLKARTFISSEDYCQARLIGMLRGCGVGQGRLLGPATSADAMELARELGVDSAQEVWTGGAARMNGECAAHKVLDLVGDLALWLGFLPCMEIEMRNVGHAQFHALGRRLLSLS